MHHELIALNLRPSSLGVPSRLIDYALSVVVPYGPSGQCPCKRMAPILLLLEASQVCGNLVRALFSSVQILHPMLRPQSRFALRALAVSE